MLFVLLSSRLVLSELNYLGWSCVKLVVGRKKSKTSSSRLYQIYSKIVISYLVLFHRVSSSPFFPKPDFLAPHPSLSLSVHLLPICVTLYVCVFELSIINRYFFIDQYFFINQYVLLMVVEWL